MDNNYVFDWEDEINNESVEYPILPEGDYTFFIEKFERGIFDGSEKLPACKKATVYFKIYGADDTVTISENFLLCAALEWKLSALFLSVGLKKHGEPIKMKWNEITGKTGRCHIYVDNYKKKDGSQGQSNKIKKFYAYDDDVVTVSQNQNASQNYQQPDNTAKSWQAGKF